MKSNWWLSIDNKIISFFFCLFKTKQTGHFTSKLLESLLISKDIVMLKHLCFSKSWKLNLISNANHYSPTLITTGFITRYSTKILWIFYSCEKGLIIAIKIIPILFYFLQCIAHLFQNLAPMQKNQKISTLMTNNLICILGNE